MTEITSRIFIEATVTTESGEAVVTIRDSHTNIVRITVNGETGVYGSVKSYMKGIEAEVALAQEVNTGDAEIITTIEGQEPKRYTAVIEKIALSSDNPNRNMVVRVTDPRLLTATGGIVQGMSGSPILQDGRLVGAVTHVLVNDPTRGYGIFAENMVQSADAAAQREAA